VPEKHVGAAGEGFIGSLKILDGGRISIAALGLGMAQGLWKRRQIREATKTFGQPISEFQAIQFKLADMATQRGGGAIAGLFKRLAADSGVTLHTESSMAKLFRERSGGAGGE